MKESESEAIREGMMVENSLELMKYMNPQLQKPQHITSRLNRKKYTYNSKTATRQKPSERRKMFPEGRCAGQESEQRNSLKM